VGHVGKRADRKRRAVLRLYLGHCPPVGAIFAPQPVQNALPAGAAVGHLDTWKNSYVGSPWPNHVRVFAPVHDFGRMPPRSINFGNSRVRFALASQRVVLFRKDACGETTPPAFFGPIGNRVAEFIIFDGDRDCGPTDYRGQIVFQIVSP
jgi:hypothetical protein